MNKNYIIAVDLGGTETKMGIFTTEGELVDKWAITTDVSEGAIHVFPNIASSVKEKIAEKSIDKDEIKALGIGVPGGVSDGKNVKKCVMLGVGDVNVSDELSKELWNIPVIVGNDANTAALGELWKGAARGYKSLVLLTIGTDIGGGIVIDGKTLSGFNGGGGEIGHMPINPHEKEPHGCGRCGCFGQYAAGTGLTTLARRALMADPQRATSLRGETLEGNVAKIVIDAAKAGDEFALEIFDDYCRIFARGLAMVSCVVDPEVFILGGGVSKAGDFLISRLEKYFLEYCFHTAVGTKILTASLANDAGIYGAAYMAMNI